MTMSFTLLHQFNEPCRIYHACAVTGRVWSKLFRKVRIYRIQPYAQYADAISFSGTLPRKRNSQSYTFSPSTGYYFAVMEGYLAPTLDSLSLPTQRYGPINMIGKDVAGSGGTLWLEEFEARLIATGVPILASYRYYDRERDAQHVA